MNSIEQKERFFNRSNKERERRKKEPLSLVVAVKRSNYNSLYKNLFSNADRTKRDNYKKQLAYVVAITDNKANPTTYIIIKSFKTLNKILETNENVLLYPYPVKVPKGFWNEYRRARTGKERIELIKKYELLKEKSVFILDKIVLDVDSDYDENIENVKKILSFVNLKAHLFKTKSSRIRIIIPVSRNKKHLTPHGKNKNGRTHLENLKEIVYILNQLFKRFGLNADSSFKYINHPIWLRFEGRDGLVYVETVNEQNDDMFYDVYSKLKSIQRAYKLYPEQKKQRREKREKAELPAFIMNRISQRIVIDVYEKAVRTLIAKNTSHTYINVIQVATGWAKWLGIEHEAEKILLKLLGERKRKDIEKGFRYAREIEFKFFSKQYDVKEYTDKMLDYLSKKGTATRQELLKEVFCNQKWLTDLVISELLRQNIVIVGEHRRGRGRPSKTVSLNFDYFSQYDNSVIEQCNGLVVDGLMERDIEIEFSERRDIEKDIGTEIEDISEIKTETKAKIETEIKTKTEIKLKPKRSGGRAVGRSEEFSRIILPKPGGRSEEFSRIILPKPGGRSEEFSRIILPKPGGWSEDDDVVDF